ncbi:uncharacterized protein LOC124290257 isoform X1 [Haliotis rubra]|uniref:uncharacterized protein LOC124290257 isoform X1 n=1 Tax=Haliotis rubra TaxID=36100 RepID=UPI001EE51E5B|nr:uncharacterized protein LOC124290257 isoform X1 [Haliotis rubra]
MWRTYVVCYLLLISGLSVRGTEGKEKSFWDDPWCWGPALVGGAVGGAVLGPFFSGGRARTNRVHSVRDYSRLPGSGCDVYSCDHGSGRGARWSRTVCRGCWCSFRNEDSNGRRRGNRRLLLQRVQGAKLLKRRRKEVDKKLTMSTGCRSQINIHVAQDHSF